MTLKNRITAMYMAYRELFALASDAYFRERDTPMHSKYATESLVFF
ncbi:hypothetical protein [Pseudoalteromonas sp. MMG022]|nr:hypothetical protein [Pseudoalteromonas sp. MMG022]MCF6436733.1 hypothetical protein [Pseudoalteromonas sp. MMG022]